MFFFVYVLTTGFQSLKVQFREFSNLLNKNKKKIAQKFFGSMTWIAKRPLSHRVAYPNLIKIIMS